MRAGERVRIGVQLREGVKGSASAHHRDRVLYMGKGGE